MRRHGGTAPRRHGDTAARRGCSGADLGGGGGEARVVQRAAARRQDGGYAHLPQHARGAHTRARTHTHTHTHSSASLAGYSPRHPSQARGPASRAHAPCGPAREAPAAGRTQHQPRDIANHAMERRRRALLRTRTPHAAHASQRCSPSRARAQVGPDHGMARRSARIDRARLGQVPKHQRKAKRGLDDEGPAQVIRPAYAASGGPHSPRRRQGTGLGRRQRSRSRLWFVRSSRSRLWFVRPWHVGHIVHAVRPSRAALPMEMPAALSLISSPDLPSRVALHAEEEPLKYSPIRVEEALKEPP
jgi:hypothetical protein